MITSADGGADSSATLASILRNQTATPTAAPSSGLQWYDPSKLAAAQQMQGAGGDGRTVLTGDALSSILNPLSGVTQSIKGYDTGYELPPELANNNVPNNLAHVDDQYTAGGQSFLGLNADRLKALGIDPSTGTYIQARYNNPTGNEGKDYAQVVYKLDANGNAVPVNAQNNYTASSWVSGGRDFVRDAAILASLGYGASALAGAGAGTGAGASAAASEAAPAVGNGAFLGEGAASGVPAWDAAYTGAGGALEGGGGALTNIANTGSDAHLYSNPQLGGINSANPSLLDQLGTGVKNYLTNPKTYSSLLKAYAGGSSGGAGGGMLSASNAGFRAPDRTAAKQAEMLRKQHMMQQQSFTPTWSGAR